MAGIYYAVKIVAILWLLFLICVLLFGGSKTYKDDRYSQGFLFVTLSLVLPAIQASVNAGPAAPGAFSWGFPIVSYIGFGTFFLGFFINILGIATLKNMWTGVVVVKEDHKLIDTGIYKFLRHPIYAGVVLELLGMSIALANWETILIIMVPNLVSIAYRIYVEEKALIKHFGVAYVNYARKTKRLIPGIF